MDHLKIKALVDALLNSQDIHFGTSSVCLYLSNVQIVALLNAVSFWKDNVQVNETSPGQFKRGIAEKCGSAALDDILEQVWRVGEACLDEPLEIGN